MRTIKGSQQEEFFVKRRGAIGSFRHFAGDDRISHFDIQRSTKKLIHIEFYFKVEIITNLDMGSTPHSNSVIFHHTTILVSQSHHDDRCNR
jgi:hypothetical protein